METSSKDASRAKYRLSQSRKRTHGGRGGKSTSSKPSGASVAAGHGSLQQASRDYDLTEDDTRISWQCEDFGKLLADATQYYGTSHGHRQAAMLDALLAPQQTPLGSHIDASQVRVPAPANLHHRSLQAAQRSCFQNTYKMQSPNVHSGNCDAQN